MRSLPRTAIRGLASLAVGAAFRVHVMRCRTVRHGASHRCPRSRRPDRPHQSPRRLRTAALAGEDSPIAHAARIGRSHRWSGLGHTPDASLMQGSRWLRLRAMRCDRVRSFVPERAPRVPGKVGTKRDQGAAHRNTLVTSHYQWVRGGAVKRNTKRVSAGYRQSPAWSRFVPGRGAAYDDRLLSRLAPPRRPVARNRARFVPGPAHSCVESDDLQLRS